MPILKHISIHRSVIDLLRYIINGDKTENGVLVKGLNCAEDAYNAYVDFKRTYEHCSGEKFENPDFSDACDESGKRKSKSRVLMHHYIQSFSPDEKITPQQANQIGIEWAKKAFGDNYQVLVTTHVDKNHTHNHIAVCPYSLSGDKWNDNMKTLNKLRKLSDKIAREHGLSVIEYPQTKNYMKYKEWNSRKGGASWKANLCERIDKLILDNSINSVNDLAQKLREEGCNVRMGKFMTVKLPGMKRAVRTDNLDKKYGGYSLKELEYRIEHKEKEISFEAISRLHGEARSHAIYMRVMQISVFQKKEHKYTYHDLTKSADLLNFIVRNSVKSLSDFERIAEDQRQTLYALLREEKKIAKKIEGIPESKIEQRASVQNELNEVSEKIKKAKAELRHSELMQQEYKRQTGLAQYEEAQREYKMLQKLNNEERLSEREVQNRDSNIDSR